MLVRGINSHKQQHCLNGKYIGTYNAIYFLLVNVCLLDRQCYGLLRDVLASANASVVNRPNSLQM